MPTLGGRLSRLKPLIPLTVTGPSRQDALSVLVDSGSDDVVFPWDVAVKIGVNLSTAATGHALGVGAAAALPLAFAPVILELRDPILRQVCRWRAVVGFSRSVTRFALFGIAGGLEHFRTTLDVAAREIHLDTHPSLPATQDAVP